MTALLLALALRPSVVVGGGSPPPPPPPPPPGAAGQPIGFTLLLTKAS